MKELYNIDFLHLSVNDVYEKLDEGIIKDKEAKEILILCCERFLKQNRKDNQCN